jgi:hypothetical protein
MVAVTAKAMASASVAQAFVIRVVAGLALLQRTRMSSVSVRRLVGFLLEYFC